MSLGGRRVRLRLAPFGASGATDIAFGALVVVSLGVESIGALPMRIELVTRCGCRFAMGARRVLQPRGFGGLGFRLGLHRASLRLSLSRDRLAPLDVRRLLPDLLTHLFGLCVPPLVACIP